MPHPLETFDTCELMEYLRISRTGIYRRMNRDNLPRPRKVGRRSVWMASEVRRWLELQKLG